MTLTEFFNSILVSLPRGGFETADCTFDEFLERLYRDYTAEARKISDPGYHDICERVAHSVSDICHLSDQIVAAARHYLQGYPHQAYEEIKRSLTSATFDSLITEVSAFDPTATTVPFDLYLESTLHPAMYRMRPNLGLAAAGTLKRKDIFHVPFENRNMVRNQRYSIAGLPCLYLGSSTWICWEELDRPELNASIFSRFKFAEKTTILDFQLPPAYAWTIYENVLRNSRSSSPMERIGELRARFNDDFIVAYILCWPLLAACSIRVDAREGSFFPQYIVPQLLLQWVTKEHKVDGIRYFSTRVTKPDAFVNANYVFPTRNIKRAGRCSFLQRKIHLVPPLHWALLQLVASNRRWSPELGNSGGQVQLAETMTVPYRDTQFFELEQRLSDLANEPSGSGPVEN